MADTVFILGAGASFHTGAPLMWNFLDVAQDLLVTHRVTTQQKAFETVFSTIGKLQQVHSKAQLNLTNIEAVFTALELGKVIRTVPGLQLNEIDEAISALKTLIAVTLEQTVKFPVGDGRAMATSDYQRFSTLIKALITDPERPSSVAVLTFNYDIALEVALTRLGIGYRYRLEDAEPAAHVDLLKLHGSINWGEESIASRQIKCIPVPAFLHALNRVHEDRPVSIEIFQNLQMYMKRFASAEVGPDPVIVPPSWNKSDYHRSLSAVWSAAAKHLSEAKRIVVFGFSLPETDAFFRHLFALGTVGPNPIQKMVVCDPDSSGAVRDRFQGMLGPGALARFEYKQENFLSALTSLRL